MFVHDETTNSLKLREGRAPPWIREFHGQVKTDRRKSWLYCVECKDRYCADGGRRNHAFIPYRDKASQYYLRPHRRFEDAVSAEESQQGTQPEPESEPVQEDDKGMEDEMESDAEASGPNLPLQSEEDSVPELPAPIEMPSLETYRARWAEKKAHHARGNSQDFSNENLVPKPVPQLWNDCSSLTRRFRTPGLFLDCPCTCAPCVLRKVPMCHFSSCCPKKLSGASRCVGPSAPFRGPPAKAECPSTHTALEPLILEGAGCTSWQVRWASSSTGSGTQRTRVQQYNRERIERGGAHIP